MNPPSSFPHPSHKAAYQMLPLAASPTSFRRHVKTRWRDRRTPYGADGQDAVRIEADGISTPLLHRQLTQSACLPPTMIPQQSFDVTGILVPEGSARARARGASCTCAPASSGVFLRDTQRPARGSSTSAERKPGFTPRKVWCRRGMKKCKCAVLWPLQWYQAVPYPGCRLLRIQGPARDATVRRSWASWHADPTRRPGTLPPAHILVGPELFMGAIDGRPVQGPGAGP